MPAECPNSSGSVRMGRHPAQQNPLPLSVRPAKLWGRGGSRSRVRPGAAPFRRGGAAQSAATIFVAASNRSPPASLVSPVACTCFAISPASSSGWLAAQSPVIL